MSSFQVLRIKNSGINTDSLLSLTQHNNSFNKHFGLYFKTYPESDHFCPPPLLLLCQDTIVSHHITAVSF